ncbi:hypothetical protein YASMINEVIRUS_628 [Yasminevirus sp. GU-2018]|uniref:NodB homology domain-containing protein n=1 Tax=Yasminevirus sp. GU-2018 TaxID=2420051 RepID=A0A5K0U8P7_9VIRU|nr:hypothetical protein YASMINEVIRUS_628 [Yasminevirus sp. GU-2018]
MNPNERPTLTDGQNDCQNGCPVNPVVNSPIDKPIVIISFDHVGSKTLTKLVLPLLQKYDIRATLYIQSLLVGKTRWNMTVDELKLLHDARWDLGNHTYTHPRLATLSAEEIDKEIKLTDDFLEKNNFSIGRRHMSYPCSSMNDTVISVVKKYCDTGRKVTGKVGTLYPTKDWWYKLDCISMKASDPVSRATERIDEAIDRKMCAHIMFESVFEENPPKEGYLFSQFVEIINYIVTKKEAGLVDVMTVSEFYESRKNKNKSRSSTWYL